MAAAKTLNLATRASRFTAIFAQNIRATSNTHLALLPQRRRFSAEKQQADAGAEAESTTGLSPDASANEKKLYEDVQKLNADLTKVQTQYEELLDKYKRSLADSENMRVRLSKQIDDAKVFGIQSFCKDLLSVADTLGHATKAVPETELKNNMHLKNLYDGLVMTKASLLQVFKRHGLEPVDPINQKFDPNYHEALFQKDATGVDPNTVVEVTQLGYKLHERCIRPALVGVSKAA